MKTVEIHPIQESQALLVGWLHPYYEEMAHRKKRPCAVICPGGAYKYCSDREADPIAEAYFAKGFQVFILYYSTTGRELERPATGLRPLGELSESVVHIRENSALYGVDPEKIAVIGFSAGAHLAGSLGVHWNSEKLREFYPSEPGKNRPNAMVLSYPVISARPEAHPEWHDSFSALLGPDRTPEEEAFFSLEEQVNEETVPAFCWHTFRAVEGVPPQVYRGCALLKASTNTASLRNATCLNMATTACPCALKRWETITPTWPTGSK